MTTLKKIPFLVVGIIATAQAHSAIVISQYVETNSGTVPKGIELWNTGSSIDLSVTPITVHQSTNGGSLTIEATLNTGTFAAGSVWVIGTPDIGTYLTNTFGAGAVNFTSDNFQFNGDDALQIQLNSVVQDTLGVPGSDPGSSWSLNGVSTANQNIALIDNSFTAGDTDGWSDPSLRFITISTNPAGPGGLDGFGLAPVPEPATYAGLMGLFVIATFLIRRRNR